MLRLRRYRVFLLFAALTIFAFYRFGNPAYWEHSTHSVDVLKEHLTLRGKSTQEKQQEVLRPKPPQAQPPSKPQTTPASKVSPPPVAAITKPEQKAPPPAKTSDAKAPVQSVKDSDDGRVRVMPNPIKDTAILHVPMVEQGSGRWEGDQLPLNVAPIEWRKPEEHFPIPSGSTIQLPTRTPKAIPKIQAEFKEETPDEKQARLTKKNAVVEAFKHAWAGYKENAWGKDELMPISGNSKNPFNGWGATLVDSLDTLWIMELKEEFEEAVEMVKKINFKTSRRSDIPLFETTIRYLGGLLGAYDVSEGKYKILLEKAAELGEIIIGAFDTPNRMPDTFYQWKPVFASQPHRAATRVVLAELGSMAIEFTRLSQLTKEPKYYDAIARITDALEEWQNHTRLPGMWPSYVDASGCERIMYKSPNLQVNGGSSLQKLDIKGNPIEPIPKLEELQNSSPVAFSSSKGPTAVEEPQGSPVGGKAGRIKGWDENHPGSSEKASSASEKTDEDENIPLKKPDPLIFEAKPPGTKVKRQLGDPVEEISPDWEPAGYNDKAATIPEFNIPLAHTSPDAAPTQESLPECVPHGLGSQGKWGTDEFTLGSLADSTYEYLPKMYILLNGLVDQYREMYEKAIDTANKNLLFRVMIPDEKREILVSGNMEASVAPSEDAEVKYRLAYRGSHLTCFVGGMFALGAKIFDRKEDLDIAAKLTDGCVWAYEMTASGIMPETFTAVGCDDRKSCAWNESKWWNEIDPNPQWRWESYEAQMKMYYEQVAQQKEAQSSLDVARARKTPAPEEADSAPLPAKTKSASLSSGSDLQKRQFDAALGRQIKAAMESDAAAQAAAKAAVPGTATAEPEQQWTAPSMTIETALPPIFSPDKPPTHEQYAKTLIEDDRIPPGIVHMTDRRYILRPEALESVFYMHRLTGNPYWRRKGWSMVSAILKHTRTPLAHAAIDDVTKTHPEPTDSMESFWLAETLKYAFLLFEEEDLWSLDEWVLNTEAHLIRRT